MAPAAARGLVRGQAEVTVVVLKTSWADRQEHEQTTTSATTEKLKGMCSH